MLCIDRRDGFPSILNAPVPREREAALLTQRVTRERSSRSFTGFSSHAHAGSMRVQRAVRLCCIKVAFCLASEFTTLRCYFSLSLFSYSRNNLVESRLFISLALTPSFLLCTFSHIHCSKLAITCSVSLIIILLSPLFFLCKKTLLISRPVLSARSLAFFYLLVFCVVLKRRAWRVNERH